MKLPAARMIALLVVIWACDVGRGQDPAPTRITPPAHSWGPIVESEFPFLGTVIDARRAGTIVATNNLTARGLALNLGHNIWFGFDLDLLRMAAVWRGDGVSPRSMSHISYHQFGAKIPEGENDLPIPQGEVLLVNGIYPGWQSGPNFHLVDPRPPTPDVRETGRGPLAGDQGRFLAIHPLASGAQLDYTIGTTQVRERVHSQTIGSGWTVDREFQIDPTPEPLTLIIGGTPRDAAYQPEIRVFAQESPGLPPVRLEETAEHLWVARVPGTPQGRQFTVRLRSPGLADTTPSIAATDEARTKPRPRWPERLRTPIVRSPAQEAYVFDVIDLPLDNPWRRKLRIADMAFLPDGRAGLVTFDGDVWLLQGLEDDPAAEWRRYTSGFHEPLGICARGKDLFVFDRNGIWRLEDPPQQGEASVHELFSNVFTQTAETREFASGIRTTPDGAFILAKGGQRGNTLSAQAGAIIRVSPDGRKAEVLGYGLRQPFLGVNPKTGWITASDQEGNYVPTTPLHSIHGGRFHGFLPLIQPKEVYPEPIAEPLLWIPRSVNASGAGQVWLTDPRMGPLSGSLIHLGYYRPEVFLVLHQTNRSNVQAAVMSLSQELRFPPLAGAINPRDGQLYLTGFQIWGSEAPQESGLVRLRYTAAESRYPQEVTGWREGILLRFSVPLEPTPAVEPANYAADRWNYRRTANYGSPHFSLSGSKGQDALAPSSAYLSLDRRSVFVGIPDLRESMQLRFAWTLRSQSGRSLVGNCYLSPRELASFAPQEQGFGQLEVDLKPRSKPLGSAPPPDAAEGRRLADLMGCTACHSVDGSTIAKVGPSWKGLFGSERAFIDGTHGKADEGYLRESIKSPTARIVAGYGQSDASMPSYDGILTDPQIQSLILYIRSL